MKVVLFSFFITILCLITAQAFSTTYYVNGTTGNDSCDGHTPEWDGTHGPKKTIQAGIEAASDTDIVSVADGTYKGDGNRDITFRGKAITVRSESGAEKCVIDCEGTIVGFEFESQETNQSQLIGFTITNAKMGIRCRVSSPTISECIIEKNSSQTQSGIGILIQYSINIVVRDCVIRENFTRGIGIEDSSPLIERCVIEKNGGAGIDTDESSPLITNCLIRDNKYAGVLCGESTEVTECIITGNLGGGIRCSENARVSRCLISGNFTKDDGGGIACSGNIQISNCIISNNISGDWGGGLYIERSGVSSWNSTILNCTISGNKAISGGGIFIYDCNPAIKNCIVWDNTPSEIYAPSSNPVISYCNIEGGWIGEGNIDENPNLVPDGHLTNNSPCIDKCPDGFQLDFDGEARPQPAGGLFDIGSDEFADSDGDTLPDYWEEKYFGSKTSASIDGDEDSDGATNREEFLFGTNPFDNDTDGDGRTDRIEKEESTNPLHRDNAEKTFYVNDAAGNNLWDGLAPVWDGVHGPKKTIQAGVDATVTGWIYTVLVAEGFYKGEGNRLINFRGKDLVLKSEKGPAYIVIDAHLPSSDENGCFIFENGETIASVIDGFTIQNGRTTNVGGGFYIEDSGVTVKNCVIQECYSAVYCNRAIASFSDCLFLNNYASNGGSAIYSFENSNIKLDRCTINGSYGNTYCNGIQVGSGIFLMEDCTVSNNAGVGVSCGSATLRMSNCRIYGNDNRNFGGGIICNSSDAVIEDCVIYNNETWREGGGIFSSVGKPIINNCIIEGNRAENGGGIYTSSENAEIMNSIIRNNNAANGGGIRVGGRNTKLTNCLIYGNTATENGGGISSSGSRITMVNCTVSENQAGACGGGVFIRAQNNGKMKNSIVWGNSAITAEEIYLGTSYEPSEVRISYSDIRNETNCLYGEVGCKLGFEEGNIFDDPLFVRGAIHDYYLSQIDSGQPTNSPCVDAGSDLALSLGLSELTTRTDGMGDEGIVDMGYHAPYVLWITSLRHVGRNVMLRWNAKPSIMYVVERSFDLVSWSPFFVGMKDHCVDTYHTTQEKFYRVREYFSEEQR